jgi:alanyl-tRNA synthetase
MSTTGQNTSDNHGIFVLDAHIQQLGSLTMKQKKKQDDRLLKQLSRAERKQQEQLRQMITKDLSFSAA